MGGEVDSKRIYVNQQCQNLNLWVLFLSYSSGVVVGWLVGFWIYGFPFFIPPSLPSFFLPFFLTVSQALKAGLELNMETKITLNF